MRTPIKTSKPWQAMPTNETATQFGLATRVIAAGFPDERSDAKGIAQATVILGPTARQTGSARLAMHEWPLKVDALLGEGVVLVFARPGPDPLQPGDRKVSVRARRSLKGDAAALYSKQNEARVQDLWRRLMAPNVSHSPWVGPWDPWRALDRAIGITPPVETAESAVLGFRRGETASLASFKRADAIMQRVRLAGSSLSTADRNRLLKLADLDASPRDGRYRKWLGGTDRVRVASLGADDTIDLASHDVGLSVLSSELGIARAIRAGEKPDQAGRRFAKDVFDGGHVDTRSVARAVIERDRRTLWAIRDRADALHDTLVGNAVEGAEATALKDTQAETAQRRLFGVQAQPMLARIFNFAVDVEFSYEELFSALGLNRETDNLLYVGALPPGADGKDDGIVWTAAKLRRPSDDFDDVAGLSGLFWPCDKHEFAAAGSDRDLRSQRDGLRLVGPTPDGRERFEITSLDLVSDVVGGQQQGKWDVEAVTHAGETGEPSPRLTQRTAGLTIIDYNVADRSNVEGGGDVLFAEDITTGARLDITAVEEDGSHDWRSLNHRSVRLSDPNEPGGGWVEQALQLLDLSATDRARLNANGIRVPTRMSGPAEAVDEAIATWQGDPLGITCQPQKVFVPAADDFAIYQHQRPLNADADGQLLLPPTLRFGRPFCIGMRVEYEGGIVMPLREAEARYRQDPELTLPPPALGGRRFLRQERIDPPLLALDASQALAPAGPSPIDGAGTAILRSLPSDDGGARRWSKDRNRRVLTAPVVTTAFAGLHGMFDYDDVVSGEREVRGAKRKVVQPRDGLANVAFAMNGVGGFPALAVDSKGKSRLTDNADDPESRGDAVFAVRKTEGNTGATRPMPFYPDPAAREMFLAARRNLGTKDILAGTPLRVPLYAGGRKHPDALPVIVDIEKTSARKLGVEVQQSAVLSGPTLGYLDESNDFHAGGLPTDGTNVPVQRVVVRLAPGEDFDILAWCAPDPERFVAWFEACEAVATLTVVAGGKPEDPDASCLAGWQKTYRKIAKELEAFISEGVPSDVNRNCGLGNIPLPSSTVMTAVAQSILEAHAEAPISPIASPRVFRVVHGVSRPIVAPALVAKPIAVRRKFATAGGGKHPTFDEFVRCTPRDKWSALGDEEGATDVLVGCAVEVELESTHALDLIATTQSPSSQFFDDVRRSRPQGTPPVQRSEARRTYGFDVDEDGQVTLATQSITLMSVEVTPSEDQPVTGPQVIELLTKIDAKTRESGARRIVNRYSFTDPLARRVEVQPRARTRYSDLFKDHNGDVLGDTDASVLDKRLAIAGATDDFVVNATIRPARIEPKSMLPAFVWEQTRRTRALGRVSSELVRKTLVRLRLRRPWFSSGVDEQLGIVLWPPNLISAAPSDLARNAVDDPVTETGPLPLPKTTEDWLKFSDRMLGPGGQYVTRWGTDPIRKGPVADGWFMPPEAFVDEAGKTIGNLVEDVWMPVPRGEDEPPKTAGDTEAEAAKESKLKVSLLTFRPRFDLETETWFVDLPINPMSMAYPFVRLGVVRYQPNAAPEIRVSEPSQFEFQLLPERTVDVSLEAVTTNSFAVDMVLTGRASLRSASLPEALPEKRPVSENAELQKRHRPTVKARILEKVEAHPDAPPGEAIANGSDGRPLKWDSSAQVADQPIEGSAGLIWHHQFIVENASRATKYALLVEEFEQMLPASYGIDDWKPGSYETPAILVRSGNKFAARIELGAP